MKLAQINQKIRKLTGERKKKELVSIEGKLEKKYARAKGENSKLMINNKNSM